MNNNVTKPIRAFDVITLFVCVLYLTFNVLPYAKEVFGIRLIAGIEVVYLFYVILSVRRISTSMFYGCCAIAIFIILNMIQMTLHGDNGYSILTSIASYFNIFYVIVFLEISKLVDRRVWNIVLVIFFVLWIITMVTSLYGYELYPNASREIATGLRSAYNIELYYRMNIADYPFVYSSVVFCGMVWLLLIKTHKKLLVIPFLLSCVFLVKAQFMIAILFSIVFIFYLTFIRKLKLKHLIISIFVVIIIFLMFRVIGMLFYDSDFLNVSAYSVLGRRKVELLEFVFKGNVQGDLLARLTAYQNSVELFFENPVFGSFNNNSGAHSTILDVAAKYGILGVSLLLLIIKNIGNMVKVFDVENRRILKMICWMFIVFSIINTSMFSTIWIIYFFFAPLVLMMREYQSMQ